MIGYLKKRLRNNIPIKIIALLLGCVVWYILSATHRTSVWLKVPLCFYNQAENVAIEAPEVLDIHIAGFRTSLYSIDPEKLAFHINAQTLQSGDNFLTLDADQLFLPNTIKLLSYYPMNIMIHVDTQKIDDQQCI